MDSAALVTHRQYPILGQAVLHLYRLKVDVGIRHIYRGRINVGRAIAAANNGQTIRSEPGCQNRIARIAQGVVAGACVEKNLAVGKWATERATTDSIVRHERWIVAGRSEEHTSELQSLR